MPKKAISIKDFSGGVSTHPDPRDIRDNECANAENLNFSKSGIIKMFGECQSYSGTVPDLAGFWQTAATVHGISATALYDSNNAWVDSIYNYPGVGLFSFSSKYSDADTATSVAGTTEGSNLISPKKYVKAVSGGSQEEGHGDTDWKSNGNFKQEAAQEYPFWHHYMNDGSSADTTSYIELPNIGVKEQQIATASGTNDYPNGCRFNQHKIFCNDAEGQAKYEGKRYLLTFTIHMHNMHDNDNATNRTKFPVSKDVGTDKDDTLVDQLVQLRKMHDSNDDGSGGERQFRLKKIIIKEGSGYFVDNDGSDIEFYNPLWSNNDSAQLSGDYELIPNTHFHSGNMYTNGLAGCYSCVVTSNSDLWNGGAGTKLRFEVDVDAGNNRYMHDDNGTYSDMRRNDHQGTTYGPNGGTAGVDACESFFIGNIGLYKIADEAPVARNYLFLVTHSGNETNSYWGYEHNNYGLDHYQTYIHSWDDQSGIWDRYSDPYLDSAELDEVTYAPHMNSRNRDPRAFKVNGALWFYNLGHREGWDFGDGTMKLSPSKIAKSLPNGGTQYGVDQNDRVWQFSCANGTAGNWFPSRTATLESEHGNQGGALTAPETGVRYAGSYFDPSQFAQDDTLHRNHMGSYNQYYQFITGQELIARSLGSDAGKYEYRGAYPSQNIYFFYGSTSTDPAAGGGWNALGGGAGYRLWCSYMYEDGQESQLVDLDQNNQNGGALSDNEIIGQRLYGRVRIPKYWINSYHNSHDRVMAGKIKSFRSWHDQGGARNSNFSLVGARIYFSNEIEYPDSRFLMLDISFEKGVKQSGQDTDYVPWSPVEVDNHTGAGGTMKTLCYESAFDIFEPPLLYTYEALNGYGPKEVTAFSYNTAVVANRRLYASDGITIRRSPVNAFSILPEVSTIEIIKDDGDPIIALHEFGDRLLVFKIRKLHIINISDEIDFLEETINFMGINSYYHVVTIDYGIVWFNNNGLYHFDGQSIKNLLEKDNKRLIDIDEWQTFIQTDSQIMYEPKNRDILIKKGSNNSKAQFYLFNVTTQSWSKSHATDAFVATASHAKTTNWVIDHNDNLIVGHDVDASDNYKTIKFVKWNNGRGAGGDIVYSSKDFDFGQPGVKKKLCKVYLAYKGNAVSARVKYTVNGDTDYANDGFNFNSTDQPLLDMSSAENKEHWTVASLKPTNSSDANNRYSFQIHVYTDPSGSGPVDEDFQINDITLVYRTKSVK